MEQYEEDLKAAGSESSFHKTVANLSKDYMEFKGLVWKTLASLKSQMELLALGLDRHEMASRMKVLLLHGLPEENSTNLVPSVINFFSNKMCVSDVSSRDITACHRLGNNTSKPRPLLVRFERQATRNTVWRNKTKLKGSGFTLSEFLTKPRHETFVKARKHFGINRCWTSEGRIIIQVADNKRRRVESTNELRELMINFPVTQASEHPQLAAKPESSDPMKKSRRAVK